MGNCFSRVSLNSHYPTITADIIDNLELTELNKLIIINRYVRMMQKLDTSTYNTTFMFNFFSILITIGSILVPALLSIENKSFFVTQTVNATNDNNQKEVNIQSHYIFWITFSISVVVTVSNGIIKLFAIDKTYIIRHLRYNDLRRQGWLFFSLAGPYIKYNSHNEAIRPFLFNIEKLRSNQILEEFTPETSATKEQLTYDIVAVHNAGSVGSAVNAKELIHSHDTTINIQPTSNEENIIMKYLDKNTASPAGAAGAAGIRNNRVANIISTTI